MHDQLAICILGPLVPIVLGRDRTKRIIQPFEEMMSGRLFHKTTKLTTMLYGQHIVLCVLARAYALALLCDAIGTTFAYDHDITKRLSRPRPKVHKQSIGDLDESKASIVHM